MILFTGYTILSVTVAISMVIFLVLLNEVTRRNLYASLIVFIAFPLVCTFFIWPQTAENATWFAWVKTYSALAGVLGFLAYRHIKALENKKAAILFPSVILILNIIEAIFRDFEVYGLNGEALISEGLQPGPWNIINGIAGILLVLSMSGFSGVKIARTRSKDMIWPDQTRFWIIAYALWNISFCYNSIPIRSFYAGVILNVTAIVIAFKIKEGAWLQHRAQTLAFLAMFSLLMPRYDKLPYFSITTTGNEQALLALSVIALIANLGVLLYGLFPVIAKRRNPLLQDIHLDLRSYKRILELNKL